MFFCATPRPHWRNLLCAVGYLNFKGNSMITTYNQIDKAGALVLKKVSQRHDCTPEEMVGPTKPDRIAVPRHMAYWLLRVQGYKFTQIAELFNRTHAAVCMAAWQSTTCSTLILTGASGGQNTLSSVWRARSTLPTLLRTTRHGCELQGIRPHLRQHLRQPRLRG